MWFDNMKVGLAVLLSFLVLACRKSENKEPSINSGNINVGVDESILKLIDEESGAYMNQYKGAKINNFAMPENEAVKWLLNDSVQVVAITRLLTDKELELAGEDLVVNYKPAPIAMDAVLLITNKDFLLSEVSVEKLRNVFSGKDSSFKLVFDGGNSSNLNQVMAKLGLKEFNRENVVSAGGTSKVFDWVQKDKNAIGFVGYNFISEKSSKDNQDLKATVKILSVSDSASAVFPNKKTILNQTYPFNRIIYLHTFTTTWGVENGFIRYASSKPGQLIAEKMDLIPYFAVPKQFVIAKEPINQ